MRDESSIISKSKISLTLEKIWKDYSLRLFQYLLGLPGMTYESAEDLIQESMLKIRRGLNGFDASRPVTPWLFAVVKNTYRDYRRKIKRNPQSQEFRENDFSTTTGRDEDLLAIRNFLSQLRPLDAEIAFLRYSEDMPIEEIARICKKQTGTVKFRLFEIRKKFKAYWEADDGGK